VTAVHQMFVASGAAPVAGSISVNNLALGASLDLTATGYRDYFIMRVASGNSYRKISAHLINKAEIATIGNATAASFGATWDTAFPDLSATDAENMGTDGILTTDQVPDGTITLSGNDAGVAYDNGGTPSRIYSIAATGSPQVVRIHWGSLRNDGFTIPGTVGFELSLSDASASPVTVTAIAPASDNHGNAYRTDVTFNSAGAGTLDIDQSMAGFSAIQVIALV
jgi:hypothetical protein